MARREVIEITCDRCTRTETQAPDSAPKTEGPEATFKFHDQEVSYEDLCRRCRDSLANYFAKATKAKPDVEEESPVSPVDSEPAVKKGGIFGGRKTG